MSWSGKFYPKVVWITFHAAAKSRPHVRQVAIRHAAASAQLAEVLDGFSSQAVGVSLAQAQFLQEMLVLMVV